MRIFKTRLRIQALFHKKRVEQDLTDEIRFHLGELIEQNVARGMTSAEARYAALQELGGVEQIKEECRDMRRVNFVDDLLRDLGYGLRQLRRSPGFTATAIVVLALGIGANTAMFSVVDAVLLRSLPYKHPDRLVVIWQTDPAHRSTGVWFDTYREFETWRQHSRSFDKLAAATWATPGVTLLRHGERRDVVAIPVSAGFFSLLGVEATRGRTFVPSDVANGCSVVLAYAFWQNRLGGTPGPGGSLALGKDTCTVVGIMPKDFSFYPKQTELWTLITPESAYAKRPWEFQVGVFGLLKPGATRASAGAELGVLQKGTMGEAPADLAQLNSSPVALNLQQEFTWLTGRNLRASLLVLFGAVVFVLLIASVNVANLLLGRASRRQRELGIRAALGSGRARLIRQLLTESVLLAACGASLGSLISFAGIRYLRTANPIDLPPGNPVSLSWQVFVFTAAIAVLAGLLFGLVPAWKASRLDVNEVLKGSSHGIAGGSLGQRTGRILVITELGLSLVLLAGAGLLIESVNRLSTTPLGFQPDHLLAAGFNLPIANYSKPEQQLRFYDRLALDLGALPGVKGVALAPPFSSGGNRLAIEGRAAPSWPGRPTVDEWSVSAGYFRIMDIPLLRGREFDSRDQPKSLPVAIVNQALAREYFPNEDPVGREIKLGKPEDKNPWFTIVGVAGDVKTTTLFTEMGYVENPCVYRPLKQDPGRRVFVYLRAAGDPLLLAPAVRREVSHLDSDLVPSDPTTMNQWLAQFRSQPRLRAIVLSIFAGLALLLTAVGVYGVLSQSVSQRTHEIGVRMALGAGARAVLGLVVQLGIVLALIGVGIGIAASLGLTRLLAGLLYGVKPADPLTFALVSLVLILVAVLASYIPARRATKVDPVVALRYE
ncbi:MAG TPA: ABC transporter permease [Terriglobia bacterium]|nr:ABC transporter permease [Terriglobia bacterium]